MCVLVTVKSRKIQTTFYYRAIFTIFFIGRIYSLFIVYFYTCMYTIIPDILITFIDTHIYIYIFLLNWIKLIVESSKRNVLLSLYIYRIILIINVIYYLVSWLLKYFPG